MYIYSTFIFNGLAELIQIYYYYYYYYFSEMSGNAWFLLLFKEEELHSYLKSTMNFTVGLSG